MNPGESDHPDTLVAQAVADAMTTAEAVLLAAGARAEHIYVILHARGVPEGELDCCTAGHGYADGAELFAELIGHLSGMAKAMGLDLQVIPQIVARNEG